MSEDVETVTGRFVGVAGLKFTAILANCQIVVEHKEGGSPLHYSVGDALTFVRKGIWKRWSAADGAW